MFKILRTTLLASAVLLGGASVASATPVMYYSHTDGSNYLLDETHVGNLFTFTFYASFAGVTTSDALGDYALLMSFKTNTTATFSPGSVLDAPGVEANWQIVQDDSNSNGCKTTGPVQTEWCIELKHNSGALTGPIIATGTLLKWQHTMTLTGGVLSFGVNWPFKFATTTGWDADKNEWAFGHYQISEDLLPCAPTVKICTPGVIDDRSITETPEPASLLLLGGGLAALAVGVRRRRRA